MQKYSTVFCRNIISKPHELQESEIGSNKYHILIRSKNICFDGTQMYEYQNHFTLIWSFLLVRHFM